MVTKKTQANEKMLKKIKEIIAEEAQKNPDFKIIPICVYPKNVDAILKDIKNNDDRFDNMGF